MTATEQIDQFHSRFREYLEANDLLENTQRIHAGFSGGADSTALLLLLKDTGPELEAVHLHHGLRGKAADDDAEWCRDFCRSHRIPFTLRRLDVPQHKMSGECTEAAARRCRLEFWEKHTGGDSRIALGHHADDALENMLIRMSRGANSSGLTGLRPQQKIRKMIFIHPLLDFRREELEHFLVLNKITDWRIDETNSDTKLLRNSVRHEWIPLVAETVGHVRGMRRTLEALEDDAEFLENAARDTLDRLEPAPDLRTVHPALLPRVVRLWLRKLLKADVILSRSTLLRLHHELNRNPPHPVEIPIKKKLSLILQNGKPRIKQQNRESPAVEWSWKENPELDLPHLEAVLAAESIPCPRDVSETNGETYAFFPLNALPDVILVRTREDGDRMIPFGMKSPKKLKKIFHGGGIPRDLRNSLPVVVADTEIIWIPTLKRSALFSVDPSRKKQIIRLRYRKKNKNQPESFIHGR